MRVAVLGWGSLIWDQRELRTEGGWRRDGPFLPLEFARASQSWPLTLVIHAPSPAQQVLWSVSAESSLPGAVADLSRREGCLPAAIGRVTVTRKRDRGGTPVEEEVRRWASGKCLDGAVWTALPSNFLERTGMPFSIDNAISYLQGLSAHDRERAKEYIVNAPEQVRTPLRERAVAELGW